MIKPIKDLLTDESGENQYLPLDEGIGSKHNAAEFCNALLTRDTRTESVIEPITQGKPL